MMFNWLSLAAGICYVVLGVFMFFNNILEPLYSNALGVLLVLYGIFRLWRVSINFRNREDDEE